LAFFVPFSGIGSGRFRFSLNCLLFFPFKHQFGAFCADYCAWRRNGFLFFSVLMHRFVFGGFFFAFRQTEFAALRRIFFCSAIGGTGVFKMVNHHFGFFVFKNLFFVV
jgi:hypothetical protein